MTVKDIFENKSMCLNDVYEEMFVLTEQAFLEEFGVTAESLIKNKYKRPYPYLKTIYVHYLLDKGIPLKNIADRLKIACSSARNFYYIYNDNYRYMPEFRDLADRFNRRFKD